jgi:hypothetical protein
MSQVNHQIIFALLSIQCGFFLFFQVVFYLIKLDSTAKTGCLTPMGVFNSKNCLEQIAQKVLFQLKIANLDLHYYGFVFVNLNLGIISLLLAFSASLACPEPSGKTA